MGRSGGLFRSNFWLLCSLHQEREERRGEMEFVPKARYEDCGEERDDDLQVSSGTLGIARSPVRAYKDLAIWSALQRDSCTPPSHRARNKNCYHTLNYKFPGIPRFGVENPETVTTR